MADEETFPAEVRRVVTQVADTGTPGPGNPSGYYLRDEVSYEVGFESEGAWVRISSVPGSTVEALVARARDAAPPEQTGPTMTDVTPTPLPQLDAATGEGQ